MLTYFFDIYGTDIYFEENEYFKNLRKENLHENLWKKEIDMLVRCGLTPQEAHKTVFNYFQSISDSNTYMYSYSYCVVDDLIYEIYYFAFPENSGHLSNVYYYVTQLINYEDESNPKPSKYDFCVMWNDAGSNLKSFISKYNMKNIEEKLRENINNLYGDDLPEKLTL